MNGPARRLAAMTVSACVVCLLLAGAATAATVPLVGVSATADQNHAGGIAATINGNLAGGGWALATPAPANDALYNPQAAIFTPLLPVDTSQLYFNLVHGSGSAGHSINEFRISVTDSPVVGPLSSWTQLTPDVLGSTSTVATLTTVGDSNRVRVANNYEGSITYGVSAPAPFDGITAFRLEVFPYDYNANDALPATIGRATNGNIILTEFEVDTSAFVTNVAYGKTASGQTAFGAPPSRGVDGIFTNYTHTGNVGAVNWEVDLGQPYDLARVDLINRYDCCGERLNGAVVSVLDAGSAAIDTADPVSGIAVEQNGQTFSFDNDGVGFSGAQFVRADHNDQYLAVSEVRALVDLPLETPNPANLALGRLVTAFGAVWPGLPESRLTDGAYNLVTHPAQDAQNGFYYEIDMGEMVAFDNIDVYRRPDTPAAADRLLDYRVQLLDGNHQETWTGDIAGVNVVGGFDGITVGDGAGAFEGQFIRILNNSGSQYNPQIAEVEAYGQFMAPAEPEMWNLALGAPVTASAATGGNGPAPLLTDGGVGGVVHPGANLQNGFYFQIDMGETIAFDEIDVYGRVGCCPERLSNYRVELLDENLGVNWTGDIPGVAVDAGIDNITAGDGTGTFTGQFIRISNNSGMAYNPQIAEVAAYGTVVPEPGSLVLLVLGALGLAVCGARRRG